MSFLQLEMDIEDITYRYKNLIHSLNIIYDRLDDFSDNLPSIFLTKKGIKQFIIDSNKDRDGKIVKATNDLEKIKKLLLTEKDKKKIQSLKRHLEKKSLQINYINQNRLGHDDLTEYFYENIILLSTQGRRDAVSTYKKAIIVNAQLKKYLKFYSKKLLLEGAEDFFKGKVTNVTETMKKSYVESHDGILELDLLVGESDSLESATLQLIKQFEYDIGNFRRFYDHSQSFNSTLV